mgnify:CR=1 FL=1
MTFIEIENILKLEKKKYNYSQKRKILLEIIKKNMKEFELNKNIKLPQLIFDKLAPFVIPHIVSAPNFVTSKKIVSNSLILKSDGLNLKLSNKIVLIENADPGFDWIFEKGISGLITKFGGANSHMTIRCSELYLPAAIGVGEKKFLELQQAKKIELDCFSKKINVLQL